MAESERDDADGDLRRQFAAMPAQGPCLDDAAWDRLAGREMTPFERQHALEHVTTCASCGAIYRALRLLETEARAFDPGVPAAPHVAAESSFGGVDARKSWFVGRQLAAAMLALVAIGALAWWNVSLRRANARLETTLARANNSEITELRRRLAAASAPQLNVPLVSLEPDALRGEPGAATVVLPADANLVTIVLNTADDRDYQDHELRILDGRGSRVWSGRGLRKSARNTFTLSVPRDVLGVGEYRLELTGLRDGQAGTVQAYQLRVTER
jgi:hypothetical protein